jgi:hypothetical protein
MARLLPNCHGYKITSPFGMRKHPVTGGNKMHNGIDLVGTNNGTMGLADYIAAHTGGTVESCGYSASAGYYINIRTSANTVMAYYHLREMPYFKKGATVKTGDKIGYMGKTGAVTGVHLHWGIKVNGSWIDPEPFLSKDYSESSATTKGEETVKIEMNVLRKGSKGEQVKTLQRLLISLGYDKKFPDFGNYGADGSFGAATDKAVREFQSKNCPPADGSVGQKTWDKLLKG